MTGLSAQNTVESVVGD